MSFLIFLIGYIIPAIGIILTFVLCIFVEQVAREFRVYSYGDIIIGILVGLIPVLNMMVFYVALLLQLYEMDRPSWWYLDFTKK